MPEQRRSIWGSHSRGRVIGTSPVMLRGRAQLAVAGGSQQDGQGKPLGCAPRATRLATGRRTPEGHSATPRELLRARRSWDNSGGHATASGVAWRDRRDQRPTCQPSHGVDRLVDGDDSASLDGWNLRCHVEIAHVLARGCGRRTAARSVTPWRATRAHTRDATAADGVEHGEGQTIPAPFRGSQHHCLRRGRERTRDVEYADGAVDGGQGHAAYSAGLLAHLPPCSHARSSAGAAPPPTVPRTGRRRRGWTRR